MKYSLKIEKKWLNKILEKTKKFEYRLGSRDFNDLTELELICGNEKHTFEAKLVSVMPWRHFLITDTQTKLDLLDYYGEENLKKFGVALIQLGKEIK